MVADEEASSLEKRLGRLHAGQRIGVERDHEGQVFGQGLNFFHVENSRLSAFLISAVLKLTGTYWVGARNAARVQLRENVVLLRTLPTAFDGFTILHLSDLLAFRGQGRVIRREMTGLRLDREIQEPAYVLGLNGVEFLQLLGR